MGRRVFTAILPGVSLPPYLSKFFVLTSNRDDTYILIRGQSTLSLAQPNASSRYGFYALPYLAADMWNSLPTACRQAALTSVMFAVVHSQM